MELTRQEIAELKKWWGRKVCKPIPQDKFEEKCKALDLVFRGEIADFYSYGIIEYLGNGFYSVNGIKAKVIVADKHALRKIKPDILLNYLKVNSWQEVNRVEGELIVFRKKGKMVWMPVSDKFSDYSEMVYRVIQTIAVVEKKSELSILVSEIK